MKKHGLLNSSIGRKLLVALTGLFLCAFLIAHLSGNLQLLKGDNGVAFNTYAEFMGSNPLIQFISKGNFFFILLHLVLGLVLTFKNRGARKNRYAKVDASKSSSWSSRNMALLGTIILIFLVVHLQAFWFQMKYGTVPMTTIDGMQYKDLYATTVEAFGQWWIVLLYVISMIALAFHLHHGFQSAFRTLGLNHKKFTSIIQKIGLVFSIIVPALFALIPIYLFISQQ